MDGILQFVLSIFRGSFSLNTQSGVNISQFIISFLFKCFHGFIIRDRRFGASTNKRKWKIFEELRKKFRFLSFLIHPSSLMQRACVNSFNHWLVWISSTPNPPRDYWRVRKDNEIKDEKNPVAMERFSRAVHESYFCVFFRKNIFHWIPLCCAHLINQTVLLYTLL